MKGIYLLLGSNLGDRLSILARSRQLIEEHIGVIVNASSIYLTKAWGIEDQPDFLNQVVEVSTTLAPTELLLVINKIEIDLGRKRYVKWGSRIVDIDILYFGDLILESPELTIPHPENQNRNFVLVPMTELTPEFKHPKLLKTQAALLANCSDRLEVRRFNEDFDN